MPDEQRSSTAATRQSILSAVALLAFLAVGLFLPAGEIGWVKGWLLLLFFVILTVPSVVYLRRTNPDIFVARSKIHEGTKDWDKALVAILLLSFAAEFPIAAFDAGRFHWSSVPLWLIVVGYALLSAGYVVSVWAYRVNKFAEPGVRIQRDRGQKVIDSGPYALVRHPVYVGGFLMAVGIPLALGSFWALVPAAIGGLTIAVRIVWEERTLREELEGYTEYAGRVRYRLFPGIW
jgi:protein-S-isoprenylcysteine O-methyltransferase Ste14